MSRIRVYLPMTPRDLATLRTTGALPDERRRAYAVTPDLERAHPNDRLEEELEYAALTEAAGAAREGGSGVRVIAAADVEATEPPHGGADRPGAVDLAEPLHRRRIASFHVDESPGGSDEDLLWYDVTELDEVARLAGA